MEGAFEIDRLLANSIYENVRANKPFAQISCHKARFAGNSLQARRYLETKPSFFGCYKATRRAEEGVAARRAGDARDMMRESRAKYGLESQK